MTIEELAFKGYQELKDIQKIDLLLIIEFLQKDRKQWVNQYSKTHNDYVDLQKKLEQLKEIEKEHQKINGELRVENKELKYKINNLILFAYGTEMSLGEFKAIFKLAFDKEHNPKIPIEKQVGGKQ